MPFPPTLLPGAGTALVAVVGLAAVPLIRFMMVLTRSSVSSSESEEDSDTTPPAESARFLLEPGNGCVGDACPLRLPAGLVGEEDGVDAMDVVAVGVLAVGVVALSTGGLAVVLVVVVVVLTLCMLAMVLVLAGGEACLAWGRFKPPLDGAG